MNTYSSTNKNRISSHLTKEIRVNDANVSSKGTVITPVYLNLYDLGGCVNACVHTVGLSFYHCAVQAHAAEYGFMGHPFKFTGIYKTSKHDSRFHLYRLRDTIEFGWTWFTENDIDEIVNEFKSNYFGCDYHLTKKNSVHFVRDFLVRLTNEINLKQIKSIDLNQFPSYIDRCRRWSENVTFLKYFDYEKEIAEINILYFLYMKFEGNLPRICRIIKCETIEQLKRTIKLIKQGIDNEKIPRFLAFQTTEMQATYECLHPNETKLSSFDDEITLTDIFHQFDTITLRGRTSIDRYLNIQRNENRFSDVENIYLNSIHPHHQGLNASYRNELNESISVENDRLFNEILPSKSSFSDDKYRMKQNVLRQSFVSSIHLPGSNIKMNSFGKLDSFVSMPLVSTVKKSNVRYLAPVQTILHLDETLHPTLIKDDLPSDSLSTNHFDLSTSKKRKLPRDLQLSHDLYKLSSQKNQQLHLTNNAICQPDSFTSFPTEIFTDSTV